LNDLLREIADDLSKLIAFRSRDPFKPQPFWREADELEHLLHHSYPLGGYIVSLSIMALPNMAARHQNTICTLLKGFEDKMGRDSATAHHPDG